MYGETGVPEVCAPQIVSSLDRPDYWVECRPCNFRSEDYLNLKDVAAAFAWHCAGGDE
jgi:hypothetical protein